MKALTDLLYIISNALLGPAVIMLLALFCWTLILFGGFLKEALERPKVRRSLERAVRAALSGDDAADELQRAGSGLPARITRLLGAGNFRDLKAARRAIAVLENEVTSVLARHALITRISPMIGLMATLIPLGPALSELAAGNMQALAGNLVVAFTATVIGLLVSAVAYAMGLTRRAWYARDMVDLETVFADALREVPEYVA